MVQRIIHALALLREKCVQPNLPDLAEAQPCPQFTFEAFEKYNSQSCTLNTSHDSMADSVKKTRPFMAC